MGIAFVFPGQGSQAPGMQRQLAADYRVVRQVYDEAGAVLGYDLWALVQDGPAAELDRTVVTQPAMLTAGFAAWRCWQQAGGPAPQALAGHSLGEYTALVCAGALGFAEAVALVQRRGELMQDAVPPGGGAMAAILGLDDAAVGEACAAASGGGVVSAVNFNAPGQVVIAGERGAVERAVAAAREAGARRAQLLNVSVPSHCELMRPAAGRLAERLAEAAIDAPRLPVINNVDVEAYRDAAQVRDGLTRQLYNPVRWVETVRALLARGASAFVECGPGKVLTGLAKRIERSAPCVCLEDAASLETALRRAAGGDH